MSAPAGTSIASWHAHVYFDAATLAQAEDLCERAGQQLPVQKGRVHQKPVGPHPQWSCQLAFASEHLNEVVHWLTLNRAGLTVFMHPNSGNDLVDHRDRAIWFGTSDTLNLAIFQ
ncbi:MAG: DOPA 4,5-dioxygenase family protein [Burkholderiaceae bacterium]